VEAFVSECVEASEVMGDTYVMPRERFNAISAKWRPRRLRPPALLLTSHPHESEYPNGLGTLARRGIDMVSLGMAKPLAMALARMMGKPNCGCDAREKTLNELVPDVRMVKGAMGWARLVPKILVERKRV